MELGPTPLERSGVIVKRHRELMEQLLGPMTQAAVLFAAMFVLTAIGISVARRYRDREAQDISATSDIMSKFRELHAEGGLSDEEFRTIKTKLAHELKTELTTSPEVTVSDDTGTG